jgi:hypothetical protein
MGYGAAPHETHHEGSHRPSPPPHRHGRLPRPSRARRRNHLPWAAAPASAPEQAAPPSRRRRCRPKRLPSHRNVRRDPRRRPLPSWLCPSEHPCCGREEGGQEGGGQPGD